MPVFEVERKAGFAGIDAMASEIPFINTRTDCDVLQQLYKDSQVVRVSLETLDNIRTNLPARSFWIDPAVDGYHHRLATSWPRDRDKWNATKQQLWDTLEGVFSQFKDYEMLADETRWKIGELPALQNFIMQVLDKCNDYKPAWISVPQLPLVNDGSRNKINQMLAQVTAEWKEEREAKVKLILPVIFTKTTQLTRKAIRDKKFQAAKKCYNIANADGIWVADTTLSDQTRNEQYPNRYAKLIDFHVKIAEALPHAIKLGGPYWGINIVLWARGLCDYPVISLGAPAIYYLSCGTRRAGKIRLVIPPLKRWIVASPEYQNWLKEVVDLLDEESVAAKSFADLLSTFPVYRNRSAAVTQAARFYRDWLTEVEATAEKGRALGLFQSLSSGYVFGKQLPKLPETAVPGCSDKIREAGKVAEQLMLKCL